MMLKLVCYLTYGHFKKEAHTHETVNIQVTVKLLCIVRWMKRECSLLKFPQEIISFTFVSPPHVKNGFFTG